MMERQQPTNVPPGNPGANPAETLVRNNIGWMISVAQRLLGDRALAEDAVQDAFISAFRGLDDFENRASLKTWLHRITVNAALMKLRKIKRRSEQSIDVYQPEFDEYECRIEAPWKHIESVEDILENEQRRTQVRAAIDQLPDNYRIVLLLRDIEGYSTNEVAQMLELSGSNVKIRLHRARAALKKLIEPILRGKLPS
ncbi:MAG: sigma-70 family RNA polymerase sigma factor [Gammaproteobacteria bacterium]|nr:MAG: sigma-70 family RNA polymerase sigma factor [Gammaproteobacteria bacterium]